MKILFHDYSGHLPQIQISREMSRRGHEVLHLYAEMTPSPKANMERQMSDPASLQVDGVDIDRRFEKHQYIK